VNRKNINDIIKSVLPVNSEVIGYPRKTAVMREYLKANPGSGTIKYLDRLDFSSGAAVDIPVFFKKTTFNIQRSNFIARLNGARVWGKNGAVIGAGDYFITDVAREFNQGMNIAHSVYYTLIQVKSQYITGNTAVIGTAGANIYYHWMIDVLPRLGLLSGIISLGEIDHFITQFSGLPFQNETLKKTGISPEKIIASNNNRQFHVKAENLYVPSFAGALDQPCAFQVDYLRNLFGNEMSTETPYRYIYVSRAKTGRRKIVNENELLNYLSGHGFEIIFAEEMTVAEQALLFSTARVIICSHGSALTNLVFCQKGTIVLDIFNSSHINSCFWFLSQVNQLDYHFMLGSPVDSDGNPKNDHTIVDPEVFKKALSKIGLPINE